MADGFILKNKHLLCLAVAALLAELAYAILNLSAMPMYVAFSLNEGPAFGMIYSVFLLTEAVSRPAFGALGDKVGRKPLLLAGPIVTAVTSYLTVHFNGPYAVYGLLVLRAIDGLGSGAIWPTAFATIGDVVPEDRRSQAMGVLNVTYMGGMALGFLMGGAANEYFHTYHASFYLVSILLLMAAAVLFIFFKEPQKVHHHVPTPAEEAGFKLKTLVRSFCEVPDMIVLACVAFVGMGMLTPIVKLYAVQHLGLSETQFGVLVAPIAAAMGIAALPLGKTGDKYGHVAAVGWGMLGSAVAMWILALFRSVLLAGVAGVLIGIGFTVAFPAWNALVIGITHPNRRGEVLGAVGMAQGLAAIVGASLGSYIYFSDLLSFPRLGIVNYNVPFWFSAISLTASSVLVFTWIAKRHAGFEAKHPIKLWHRQVVVGFALLIFLSLVSWIVASYGRPIPADKVAWSWMQQEARGRPDKAVRYVTPQFARTPTGARFAKMFHEWVESKGARYTVGSATFHPDSTAVVPITFVFPGKPGRKYYVTLIKDSGEWLVFAVGDTPASLLRR